MSEQPQSAPNEESEEHHEADDAPADAPSAAGSQAIDVTALAERVYQLLRAEVRLEQARLGYAAQSGKRGR